MAINTALVTLGCAKNLVDAERILYKLYINEFNILPDVTNADVVIVNTCAFIDDAKQEGIDTILEYAALKKEGRIKGIVVTGCMAQRYAEEIKAELPEVDCIISPGHNSDICEAIKAAAAGKKLYKINEPEKLELTGDRIRSTPDGWAYLKIADGCDNRCSYCTIPFIRGAFRSVPIPELVTEAKELTDGGVSELILIAQDTTRYGEDLYGKQALPELVEKLSEIEALKKIRIMYLYPDRISDEIIDCFANNPKVVKYIDLPLQHADEKVLKLMNRRGNDKTLLALIKKLRERVPGVTLRTTVMVGFPGENKKAFDTLLSFVKKAKFDRLGCFIFSPQDGTLAASLPDACAERTAKSRMKLIMLTQNEIMEQKNREKIGQTVEVLVEGYDRWAERWFGRSDADAPEVDGKVFFKGKNLKPGDRVNVKITEAIDLDLVGDLSEN
ncbi:MAG TPA: 30S ribosomal protein S12 methylthiotransferase RimO [Oscillospiraceae bacterium]|nr:30S ribosomal protein S12 methylthiotransferase RimO [Oscillospiraceae bacterium]HPF54988.1 30S ribosomal protein S12 methylthiotransferase RimO [Clostridiales bacterium]HPK34401.1 30S ribosomal protein S12 methylthiotransferase RimO [Oscillospiraceae bacterium]HPR76514.1 30S ribosomal protein S12 methylthiotransferase RimO [Oscillospiraceae bacterium]